MVYQSLCLLKIVLSYDYRIDPEDDNFSKLNFLTFNVEINVSLNVKSKRSFYFTTIQLNSYFFKFFQFTLFDQKTEKTRVIVSKTYIYK